MTVFLCGVELSGFTYACANKYTYCAFHLLYEMADKDGVDVRAFRVRAAASYVHQSCAVVLCKLEHLVSYDLLNAVIADFVDLNGIWVSLACWHNGFSQIQN